MKAIPLAPLLPVAAVTYTAYKDGGGFNTSMLELLGARTMGYSMNQKDWVPLRAMPFWTATLAGIIVHKVANKTINKYIRKATFGYLTL